MDMQLTRRGTTAWSKLDRSFTTAVELLECLTFRFSNSIGADPGASLCTVMLWPVHGPLTHDLVGAVYHRSAFECWLG